MLANRSFLEETGYGSDEVLGRNCRFLQGPDTDRATVDAVIAALEAEREITVELLNYRKDGSTFWNQLYISPIHDPPSRGGRSRGRGAPTPARGGPQVQERARPGAGDRAATRRDDASTFADLVQERVDALARAHATLAEAHWRDVPLERIVGGELRPAGGRRVRLSGDEVSLAPAQVQPVALLVHEMFANARRHGALSGGEGVLLVEWRTHPATGGIVIRWSESGGPPPPTPIERGYGHTMIDAIAERQLRGRVECDWKQERLVAEIVFPVGSDAPSARTRDAPPVPFGRA